MMGKYRPRRKVNIPLKLVKYPTLTGVKKHPQLSKYHKLCWEFLTYLRDKQDIKIILEGYDPTKLISVVIEKPYMHRWKPEYMKARLAKLCQLENWLRCNPLPISMLTFTTYHDSVYAQKTNGKSYSIEESWGILKRGFRLATMLIRNRIRKNVPYLWIVEPQIESGYPHIHAIFFTEFTEEEQHRLKSHWSKRVKAGNYEHGLDFSFNPTQQTNEISSIRNYLMKYMGKTFGEGMANWRPEELVFNTIAWNIGYRLFGCSNDLAKIMKRLKDECVKFEWLRTSMAGYNLTHDVNEVILEHKNTI
jgi:hypothetical protein